MVMAGWRWLNFLADCDSDIEHGPGKMHSPAGYFSGLDVGSPVKPRYDEGDLPCTTVSIEDF